MVEQTPLSIGRITDEHINIAIWPEIGTQNRAEQGKLGNFPPPTEVSDAIPVYGNLSIHNAQSFAYLSHIEQLSTLINLLNKVWVPQAANHHEIDFVSKEALKRILKVKIFREPWPHLVVRNKLDKKIDITRLRLELSSRGRTEQFQALDVIALAELLQFRAMGFNERVHGDL
jgi:hypothetical protein